MPKSTESFVRITYTTPENEMTAAEKAACERFEARINQLMEELHQVTNGVLAIEMYPCDDDCKECKAA